MNEPDGASLPEPGLDLPDFEVLRVLGQGSVATVHLARDRALDVLVAIKVLHADKAHDPVIRSRFEREGRAAASLAQHPNVVAVSRLGFLPGESGAPYLVMQYVSGRTLKERLRAEGRLSSEDARHVLRQVASALAHAHAQGFVHRDVRPENVLRDEERDRILLTDFGIAAVLDAAGTQRDRLTGTGVRLGDPRYMSPEQIRGEDVSSQSDIYQFGILGYELLTGQVPHEAGGAAEVLRARLEKDPPRLDAVRPGVDPELADLLRRCLATAPRHRPTARDLERLLDEGGRASVPDRKDLGPAELLRRRIPQIVALTVGAAITLIGLVEAMQGMLPELAMPLTVTLAVFAVLTSGVVAWFHGRKGRQRAPALEYVLLGLLAVGWVLTSWWVVSR